MYRLVIMPNRLKLLFNKLGNNHERSIKTQKNIIISLLLKGGSIVLNLATTSTLIKYINTTDYGLWLTLSSVISWFSFFDIGFGNGLRNKFAEAVAKNDVLLAQKYVSTTYGVLTIMFISIWSTFFFINHIISIDWALTLNAPTLMKDTLSKVVFVMFTCFCIQFVLKLIGTVLMANQQTSYNSIFDFLGNFLLFIGLHIAQNISNNFSLYELSLMSGIVPILIFLIATIWFFNKDLLQYKPKIKYIEFKYASSLINLGVKFFIIQIGAIFLFQTTNFVLTKILGPESVTIYNITYKYYAILVMLTGIFVTPLWPAFTDAYVKEDFVWIKSIVKQLNIYYLAILFLSLFMFMFSRHAFNLWLGGRIYISWAISLAMVINIMLTVKWNIYVMLINGTGKLFLQLILNIMLGILFIPLSVFFAREYNIIGVIYANIIINLLYAVIFPIQGNKLFNQTAKGIWIK